MHTHSPLATINLASAIPFADPEAITSVLIETDEAEVLNFLAQRPGHTVMLAGLIRDNGLVNPLNRGVFYCCRNLSGALEGVALIGHATLFETRTERALHALGETARNCHSTHMIMGEADKLDEFWGVCLTGGHSQRRICREHLLELGWPIEMTKEVPGLRLATLDDLDLIMPIHAQMAFDESGVDPREYDPKGFRERYERRIMQGRTWVWIESGKLNFKADIVSDTPEVIYLEGIWVNPESRSDGLGTRCLLQVARTLLSQSRSICVFVNELNSAALRFYERVGFRRKGVYDTVFVKST